MADSCCQVERRSSWYQNKILLIFLATAALIGLSYFIEALQPFRENFLMYFREIWWAILLGLFIGGVIQHFVPAEYITHVMSRPRKRTILYSVFLGLLTSTCCHGILAITIELYKKGAATASIIAFLLASPWANLPFAFVLIGFFGVAKAGYIILVSLIIALVTGVIFQGLERLCWVEVNPHTRAIDEDFNISSDFKKRSAGYRLTTDQIEKDVKGVVQGAISLSKMVLWWLMLGVIIAAMIASYVPSEWFRQYLGPNLSGILITLAMATVIEVCSEGMAPLSFEIFRQTGALGNALVFLMAGVATDYTEIGLLWQNVGRKTALWLPTIAVPQIILWGILANLLF